MVSKERNTLDIWGGEGFVRGHVNKWRIGAKSLNFGFQLKLRDWRVEFDQI